MRPFAFLLASVLTIGSVAPISAQGSCRFARPADLPAGPVTWLGPCRNGSADGPGVLRVADGAEPRFYFGAMRAGRPMRGVVTNDTNDPVIAWRFAGGLQAVEPATRAQTLAIYQAAADGAQATSRMFQRRGNRTSAAYYARWSRDLRTALDRPE